MENWTEVSEVVAGPSDPAGSDLVDPVEASTESDKTTTGDAGPDKAIARRARRRDYRRIEYSIRLSPDERATIRERADAAGVTMAHYVRGVLLTPVGGQRKSRSVIPSDAAALIRALTTSGVALREIAAGANAKGEDADALRETLMEVRATIKALAGFMKAR